MADIPDYKTKLWIAEAPAGVWSSGPTVIFDLSNMVEDSLAKYEQMGWTVTGPYILAEVSA